jgi:hypothetical protein
MNDYIKQPTKKSPIVSGQPAYSANTQNYPVALLPVKTSDDDSLNQE